MTYLVITTKTEGGSRPCPVFTLIVPQIIIPDHNCWTLEKKNEALCTTRSKVLDNPLHTKNEEGLVVIGREG